MSPSISQLFRDLQAALPLHSPPLFATFAPPATLNQIHDAERRLNVQFPLELHEWLQCANGQLIDWSADNPSPPGPFVIPRLRLGPGPDDFSAWGYWNSLQEIVEMSQFHFAEVGTHGREFGDVLTGPVQDHGRFVYLSSAEDPVSLALDLFPAGGGQVGQIVSISDFPGQIAWVAPSLSALLARYLDGYRMAKYWMTSLNVLSEE